MDAQATITREGLPSKYSAVSFRNWGCSWTHIYSTTCKIWQISPPSACVVFEMTTLSTTCEGIFKDCAGYPPCSRFCLSNLETTGLDTCESGLASFYKNRLRACTCGETIEVLKGNELFRPLYFIKLVECVTTNCKEDRQQGEFYNEYVRSCENDGYKSVKAQIPELDHNISTVSKPYDALAFTLADLETAYLVLILFIRHCNRIPTRVTSDLSRCYKEWWPFRRNDSRDRGWSRGSIDCSYWTCLCGETVWTYEEEAKAEGCCFEHGVDETTCKRWTLMNDMRDSIHQCCVRCRTDLRGLLAGSACKAGGIVCVALRALGAVCVWIYRKSNRFLCKIGTWCDFGQTRPEHHDIFSDSEGRFQVDTRDEWYVCTIVFRLDSIYM